MESSISPCQPTVYRNPQKLDEVPGAMYSDMADALGPRLVGMKLFGSDARGDCRRGSDVDVFVILKDAVNGWSGETREILTNVRYDYRLENDVVISIIRANRTPYIEDTFNPLYMNVRAEGTDLGRKSRCSDR